LAGLLASGVSARTWTDASGERSVDAAYIGFEYGQVKLQFTRTGKTVLVPLSALSEQDQRFVNEQIAREQADKEAAEGPPDPFTLAIRNDPRNPAHYVARGMARTSNEDYDGAIEDFTKAIKLDPRDATIYNARGIAHQRKNELIAAEREFDKAIELDPQYASAYRNRGENLRKLALDKEQSIPELDAAIEKWQRFWNYARRDNLRRAPWQPLNATRGDVSRRAVLWQMAKIDTEFGNRIERDHDHREDRHTGKGGAANHGPGCTCHACSDAKCPNCGGPLCGHGKPAPDTPTADRDPQAQEVGRFAKPSGLEDDTARLGDLAEQYIEEQRYDRAVAAYDWLLKDDPDNLVYLRDRAATHLLRGGYDRAVRDYDHLLSIRGKPDATLYYNRGCAHLAADRMQEAISDFSKAIILKPDWTLAYNNRGATYARMGEYDEAIKDFTKAIESDPSNRLAYRNRALAYKKLGQPLKAETDFSGFLKLAKEKTIGSVGEQPVRGAGK
jgi:tetratricopeptide (TPR) repeat protein